MNFFNDELIGQCVVLFFLLLVTLRSLLKKTQYTESLSILSVIALFLSVLQIFVFGLSLLLAIVSSVSLLVFISNIASLYRLANSLYTDRNSVLFCAFSYIEAFLVVICLLLCFFFKPVSYNNTLEQKFLYTGSFSRGFNEKTEIFEKVSLVVTEYMSTSHFEREKIAVVYVPSVGTTTSDSNLRLTAIAEMGYTVFSGDFYSSDSYSTGTNLDKSLYASPVLAPFTLHFMPALDEKQREAFVFQKELELEALLTIAGQKYDSVIIFSEGDTVPLAINARRQYPNFIKGVFSTAQEDSVMSYYGEGYADFVLLNPFDAFISKFNSWSEYAAFRNIGLTEKPHLRIARALVTKIEDISKGEMNDIN